MHIRLNKGASLKCLAFIVCAVVSGLSQGCGPITAHSTIAKAHIAIEAAEGARAQELAVFEYESAKLYLTKAKLEEEQTKKSMISFIPNVNTKAKLEDE